MNVIKVSLTLVMLLSVSAYGQTKAMTHTGQKVILSDDGTWQYARDSLGGIRMEDSLTTNPTKFARDKQAVFLTKSKAINVGIYINPNEWIYSATAGANPREYQFESKDHSCSASIVTEASQIFPLEKMVSIQMKNTLEVDPHAVVLKKEFRIVNDERVLFMEIKWKLKTMSIVSLGYFHSDRDGTVQVIANTFAQSIAGKYDELENFLNGLVFIKPGTTP